MQLLSKLTTFLFILNTVYFSACPANANVIIRGGVRIRGGVNVTSASAGGGQVVPTDGLIGTPGTQGFGVGVCPPDDLPAGFTPLAGYDDATNDNYGNYQYTDGSVMCFVPKYYYKIGTGLNGLAVHIIDVKGIETFSSTAAANSAGYALHRAFIDGGSEKSGFFIDKYICSNNGGVASSIKNGNPISTHADHNPIANLTACSGNYFYEVINAAHGRGVIFNCASKFIYSAIAVLSKAHGDAASSTTYCAWYDAAGMINFPKGCNNDGLGDVDDGTVSYTSDGHDTCGKTGSGTPFAKTTHNGQSSGVADVNGLMYVIALGLTRPGTSATDSANVNDPDAFYILKESTALKDLQPGWHSGASGANYEAWGDESHLSLYYDTISIPHISSTATQNMVGNKGSNSVQVMSESISGTNWLYTGLGIPMDENGKDVMGSYKYGYDYFYEYHRANLAVLASGFWRNGTRTGVWSSFFFYQRDRSNLGTGFRAACYP